MSDKKPTIMDQINAISFEGLTEDQFDFLVDRAKMSIRKSNGKKVESKAHKENVALGEQVLEHMAEVGAMSCKDVQDFLNLESNQKASAVLKVLEDSKQVIKHLRKGKTPATWEPIPEAEEVEE